MTWRVARSLDKLLAQLNAFAPNRSKLSDGSIASSAHHQANPSSDHEPWIVVGGVGVVSARDFTNDPADGLDCEDLYQALVASRDVRIKYIIWNKTITSGAGGPQPWVRRPYTGTNTHEKHLHLSVEDSVALFDDTRDWKITTAPDPSPITKAMQQAMHYPQQGKTMDGYWGPETDRDVYAIRQAAYAHVFILDVSSTQLLVGTEPTGTWAPEDEAALLTVVSIFQRSWGIEPDGIWGPNTERTWKSFQTRLCRS